MTERTTPDALFMQRMTELKGLFEIVSEDEQLPLSSEDKPALDLDDADESLDQLIYTTDNRVYWNAFSSRLHRFIQEIQRQTRSTRINPFSPMRKEIVMGFKDEVIQSIEMDADELVYNSEDDKVRMVRMMSIVTSFYCDMQMCDVFGYVSMEGASGAACAAAGGGRAAEEKVVSKENDKVRPMDPSKEENHASETAGKRRISEEDASKRNSSRDAAAIEKKRVKVSQPKPRTKTKRDTSARTQTEAYRNEVKQLTGKDINVPLSESQKQLVRRLSQRVVDDTRAGKDVYNLGFKTERDRNKFISQVTTWTGQRLAVPNNRMPF